MISKKSDDAISPVIGVMLMLVVTVVIAAAVTIFATGVVGETEAAPVAALDVKIYDYYQALDDTGGPDFHITHLSGEPVDTRDIELRFSWTHKDGSGKDCSHYSTFSAEGFEKEVGKINTGSSGDRSQPLYVKTFVTSTMREEAEFGSSNLDYYFGDAILTPGMKLTATADFLKSGKTNTNSQFMEMVFNEYHNSIQEKGEITYTYNAQTGGGHYRTQSQADAAGNPEGYCPDCCTAADAVENGGNGDGNCKSSEFNRYCNNPANWDNCAKLKASKVCRFCQTHATSECTEANDPNHECACCEETIVPGTEYTTGIMDHLQPGTAVDVMIVHTPSGKAIYDKTVIVE